MKSLLSYFKRNSSLVLIYKSFLFITVSKKFLLNNGFIFHIFVYLYQWRLQKHYCQIQGNYWIAFCRYNINFVIEYSRILNTPQTNLKSPYLQMPFLHYSINYSWISLKSYHQKCCTWKTCSFHEQIQYDY